MLKLRTSKALFCLLGVLPFFFLLHVWAPQPPKARKFQREKRKKIVDAHLWGCEVGAVLLKVECTFKNTKETTNLTLRCSKDPEKQSKYAHLFVLHLFAGSTEIPILTIPAEKLDSPNLVR